VSVFVVKKWQFVEKILLHEIEDLSLQPIYCVFYTQMRKKNLINYKTDMMMKKVYSRPSIEILEVASEKGFVQSGFDSGFIVPGGGNNGGEDDWAI
jgi:hypothetical protein